ncbi:hypothetical protein EJ04DRAFT_577248 [Polyplosphaeria fusca]|uniref:Nucleoporin n=1 Tax=Polyplosphaeria fusca TaxID=682080 RepID=A0A9P4V2A1_9PLEO|nr:hypothetical protein EJ04DRAFT_577248 [Polyplosphaeria fusca]
MAPIPPYSQADIDLSKCFNGEQQLISWELVYAALCDPKTASKSIALRQFVTAEPIIDILSQPWKPFPEDSAQEKSRFETATAPISVASSPDGQHNLDEIKANSLWLAEQATISPYAALRLAVIEWQSRPAVQLLSGLSEEEALSVQEAAGFANLGGSTFIPNSSLLATPSTGRSLSDAHFDSPEQRKARLLSLYLSTRISILRVSQLLVTWGCTNTLRPQYGHEYRVCDNWLEQLGQTVATRQTTRDPRTPGLTFIDRCLQAAKATWGSLEDAFRWNVPESIADAAVEQWTTAQLTEIVHILHLTLVHADLVTTGFVLPETITTWFDFALERGFFTEIPFASADQTALLPILQLLTSLLSLALLNVDKVLGDLDSDTQKYETWDPSSYVVDKATVKTITTVFGYARQLGPSPATPPAFAWALITFKLTAVGRATEEDHERLLERNNGASAPPRTQIEEVAGGLSENDILEMFDRKPPYEDLAETCSGFQVLDLVTRLAELAASTFGTATDRISQDRIRCLLLQLIRAALASEIVAYGPELILATHTIISGDRDMRRWKDTDIPRHADPMVAMFLADESILRPILLEQSRTRYPYETIPLLKFCSALARGEKTAHDGMPTIAQILANTTTLMQRLPESYGDREVASDREEEGANYVRLTVDLPQFITRTISSFGTSRRLLSARRSNNVEESLIVPAGTEGNIVDDTVRPMVAIWHYPHSALEYFVRLLSTYSVDSNRVEYASQETVPVETAVEIIGLFADLMHSSLKASAYRGDDGTCSPELLSFLDIGVDRDEDTVNIVLAIFEQELLRLCQQPGNEDSLELLVKCTQFLGALILIAPNRVWPWLIRSRLLESDGNGGSLASILIGTEMVLGRYDFLIGCIQLFHALVKDAVGRSVARKSSSKALTRFNAATSSDSGTSDKIMSSTLLTFGRTLASVYESFLGWRYGRIEHRLEISISIGSAFTTILNLAYGVDDAPKLSSKLTGSIAPVAEYITSLYLSKSDSNLPTNPILASLLSGTEPYFGSILPSGSTLWKQQTQTMLAFSNILVRIAMLLNKPWTHLEQQLFKATPLLARLYATSDSYKGSVVGLLENLVQGAIRVADAAGEKDEQLDKRETPSLLGHLGPRTAKNFLSILSQLDEPLGILDIRIGVWNLLSAVVSCKQQWFALYLLTGNTPREAIRTKPATTGPTRSKALLSRALFDLAQPGFGRQPSSWQLQTAMLEFVCSAQNHWSWAMGDIRKHKPFIQKLLSFLKWLAKEPNNQRTEEGVLARSYQNRFASIACEILTMYMHACRQVGDVTALKDLVPSLTYLEENALSLPSYNVSLHSNLKRNLEEKFRGVTLSNFKRTTLHPDKFGRSFFYDTELASSLLGFDSNWFGPREGQGFLGEVIRANLNLGYVESQVQLFSGWRLLALELRHVMDKDERLQSILIKVVSQCMVANASSSLPEALFGQLMALRADLSSALVQRIASANINNAEARQLLHPIWGAIVASTPDFDTVFSRDGVQYHRSLLKILYLALRLHLVNPTDSSETIEFRSSFRASVPAKRMDLVEPISSLLLEILDSTVAKGFRSLATQLHANSQSVSPNDFALLTSILQMVLAIPEMISYTAPAALIFSNSGTVRFATSLFSWSDKLTLPSNGIDDPIYGELSLLFLLSLSSLPSLAETMAVDGVLSTLNSANIMSYYRRASGMGPFDNPSRLYSIWTKGILPLCLNLLSAVGPPIAGEIASFLNQYPQQLARASNALSSRSASKITLSIASETHSLALLAGLLEKYRAQGPRLGIQATDIPVLDWDRENVKEDIDSWMARKGLLRERIVVVDEGDAALYGKKVEGGEGNELEERIIRELQAAGACLGLS